MPIAPFENASCRRRLSLKPGGDIQRPFPSAPHPGKPTPGSMWRTDYRVAFLAELQSRRSLCRIGPPYCRPLPNWPVLADNQAQQRGPLRASLSPAGIIPDEDKLFPDSSERERMPICFLTHIETI